MSRDRRGGVVLLWLAVCCAVARGWASARRQRGRSGGGRVVRDQSAPTCAWVKGGGGHRAAEAASPVRPAGPTSTAALKRPRQPERSPASPDGKWTAFIKDHNVFVRAQGDNTEVPLSKDGKEGLAYGLLAWAPDSKTLIAWRIEPGERKEVHLIESSPRDGGRARLRTRNYALPGDRFTRYELSLFDIDGKKQKKPEVERFEHEWEVPRPRWNRTGTHFTFPKVDRGHQRFRLIEIDAHTAGVRNLIDEKTKTYIWTAHAENRGGSLTYLDKTDEIIHASEQDGWRHLYLIDVKAGKVKNQITKGEWVVRGIDRIDEAGRQVWFRASGRNAEQDPY